MALDAPTPMGSDADTTLIAPDDLGLSTRMMSLRWLDDRLRWSKEKLIDLGASGDMFPTVRMFRLGVYRSRQWEFVFPANVVQCLATVEEDAEVLR